VLIMAVGAMAAPSLFAVLERQVAGQGAGQILPWRPVSLALAIVLFVIERRRVRDLAAEGGSPASRGQLLLVLSALFLTVFGQFALHPMIEAAKAGQATPLSFGALAWHLGRAVLAQGRAGDGPGLAPDGPGCR
jgi:hypothetical protein